jgi:hypothetical protein
MGSPAKKQDRLALEVYWNVDKERFDFW